MMLRGSAFAFLFGIILTAVYLLYWFIVRPLKKRIYFKKFEKDVGVSPKFIPFLGDFKHLQTNYIDKGKFIGEFLRDLSTGADAKPAFFSNMGMDDMLFINDVSMFNEFQKLVPDKIDRQSIDTTGFGRIGGTGGLGQEKTSEFWKVRRALLLKVIGINYIISS